MAAEPPDRCFREAVRGASVILADPPWMYNSRRATSSGWHGSARKHYRGLSLDDLKALPVRDLAAPSGVCLIWSVASKLPDACDLIASWGYDYRGVFLTWIKTTAAGKPALGTGLYHRSNTEFLIFGVRGQVTPLLSGVHDASGILTAPRTRHSEKPAETHARVEYVFGGPGVQKRCELFARGAAADLPDGWTGWGDQLA